MKNTIKPIPPSDFQVAPFNNVPKALGTELAGGSCPQDTLIQLSHYLSPDDYRVSCFCDLWTIEIFSTHVQVTDTSFIRCCYRAVNVHQTKQMAKLIDDEFNGIMGIS